MSKLFAPLRTAAALAAAALVAGPYLSAQVVPLSIKISQELVAPGGVAQVKVTVTEPKPISTGRGRLSSGFEAIDGIALSGPNGDAYGVAIVNDGEVELSLNSPSGTMGMATDDYPLLTIAGRIPEDAPIGKVMRVSMDPSALTLLDPNGVPYRIDMESGSVTAAPVMSVQDVRPGSALVPAGGRVSILGDGFTRDMKIRLSHVSVERTLFISPNRIDFVLDAPTRMHGVNVRAEGKNSNTRMEYFSYQRTRPAVVSLDPVLQHAVPLFPGGGTVDASFDVSGVTTGVAVQNVDEAFVTAFAELSTADGEVLSAQWLLVPQNQYLVQSLAEVFGVDDPRAAVVRVRSLTPLSVMGVAVDADGKASPIIPR